MRQLMLALLALGALSRPAAGGGITISFGSPNKPTAPNATRGRGWIRFRHNAGKSDGADDGDALKGSKAASAAKSKRKRKAKAAAKKPKPKEPSAAAAAAEAAEGESGANPFVVSGFLQKKGHKRRNWKRRFFALSADWAQLRYYEH